MAILQVTVLVLVLVLKQGLTLAGLAPGRASVFRLANSCVPLPGVISSVALTALVFNLLYFLFICWETHTDLFVKP